MTGALPAPVWKTVALLWTLFVLVLCTLPGDPAPTPPEVFGEDKLGHLAVFLVFALVWSWAGWSRRRVIAGGVAFAGFIEIWQHVLPIHRSADPLDFVADLVGLAVGLGLVAMLARTPKNRPSA